MRAATKWLRDFTSTIAIAVLASALVPAIGHAQELLWKDESFQRTSIGEPVQDILRAILEQNGNESIFRRGITGEVTFRFQNMSLEAAFNKVMTENELDFEYDPNLNTVTIATKAATQDVLELFAPQYISLGEIERALPRFGVRGGRIFFDHQTQTMVIRGTGAEIAEILKVSRHLDASESARLEAQQRISEMSRESKLQELQARGLEQDLEDAKLETEIIPLRYASVGGTTTTFQGESVSIPGIDKTLKTLMASQDVNILIGQEATQNTKQKAANQNASTTGVGGNAAIARSRARIRPTTRVSVDPRTNSLIVRGPRRVIDDIKEIVKSLDQPVPLVDIEVLIVQAEAGLSRSLGVQWAAGRTNTQGNRGIGVSTGSDAGADVVTLAGGSTANPVTLLPIDTVQNAVASFIYNGSRTFIQAQLSALSQDNRAQIISSPHVVTLNNVAAQVTSNSAIFIPVTTGDGTTSDVQSVDAGISLDITPSVFTDDIEGSEDLVRMTINATSSSFTAALQTATREIQTQVILRDKSTFVLGGLFETTRTEGQDGVPGLQDIPVLGWLFRNRSSVDNRSETVFFITPNVVNQVDLLSAEITDGRMRSHAYRSRLGKDAAKFLDGQRRRLGSEAEELHKKSGLIFKTPYLQEDE